MTSLPYDGSPDWRTVIFGGTSMTLDPGVSTTMVMAQGRGVWFGSSGSGPPISGAATGNALSLMASFSSDAADWSTYLTDGAYEAALQYRPTNCDDDCYGETAFDGVNLLFGDGGAGAFNTFVSLDMTLKNDFSFLLRDGLVEYHVNGTRYAGQAYKMGQAQILVIGDGSGSTKSGRGAMTVYGVSFDNAPTGTITLVPEPATWALMILGFGGVGATLRRRHAIAA